MHINYKRTTYIFATAFILSLLVTAAVLAGANLDSPSGPTDSGSQMYTLEQIYDRLTTGAAGTKMTTFTEPSSGPGSTMHTLDEIMAAAPALDNTNGATTANVLAGQTFWGLTASQWATRTGTMPNNGVGSTIVPTTTNQSVAAGYWSSINTVLGDTDLISVNIKSEIDLFGVSGSLHGGCHCANGTLNGTRWCDNGDGTVTDLLGYNGVGQCLEWAQDASWGGLKPWRDASGYDDAHTRASAYGAVDENWRLPTRTELNALTHGTEQVRSDTPRAFTGVQGEPTSPPFYYYWSSTSSAVSLDLAYVVHQGDGEIGGSAKMFLHYVWPVRGGQ